MKRTARAEDHRKSRWLVAGRIAVLVVAAGVASCGGDDEGPVAADDEASIATSTTTSTVTSTTEPGPPAGLLTDQTIEIDGSERAYHLFIPEEPVGAPLVMLFHGNGTSHDQLLGLDGRPGPYSVWLDIAERENIVVAVPLGDGGWNDCRSDAPTNPSSDDVAFVAALIDEIVGSHGVDPRRVFASGTSNGGHMSIRLAEEMPDRIAGFAAIAAADAANTECQTSSVAVSAMFVNGTADRLLPFGGGPMINGAEVLSADDALASWAERNGVVGEPVVEQLPDLDDSDGSTVVVTRRSGGREGTEVMLYAVQGGGHNEPSLRERISGPALGRMSQNGDIEMAEEVWAFFAGKTK